MSLLCTVGSQNSGHFKYSFNYSIFLQVLASDIPKNHGPVGKNHLHDRRSVGRVRLVTI
ncbi:hypothetical protein BDQ12DRAFT_688642 [Crucibulum laeve]|uniref:Uncharacterized protein n=1 Tax=Crucibulum laeve TaxID=68775 RepID=A0A5C3LQ34_9AGAR|nr:hypothetical protein BDQ12DRAFT_688642 [Crucibulum laeve]